MVFQHDRHVEIERRFLVRGSGWRAHVSGGEHMTQGYIVAEKECVLRLRIARPSGREAETAWLGGKGMLGSEPVSRYEREVEIPVSLGRCLLERARKGHLGGENAHP